MYKMMNECKKYNTTSYYGPDIDTTEELWIEINVSVTSLYSGGGWYIFRRFSWMLKVKMAVRGRQIGMIKGMVCYQKVYCCIPSWTTIYLESRFVLFNNFILRNNINFLRLYMDFNVGYNLNYKRNS